MSTTEKKRTETMMEIKAVTAEQHTMSSTIVTRRERERERKKLEKDGSSFFL